MLLCVLITIHRCLCQSLSVHYLYFPRVICSLLFAVGIISIGDISQCFVCRKHDASKKLDNTVWLDNVLGPGKQIRLGMLQNTASAEL